MEYIDALQAVSSGKAIIFIGSGFSLGADSVSGKDFPTGVELARILCVEAGAPATDDLKIASSRYLRVKRDDELISFLRKQFSVRNVNDSHREIAAAPWKGIYTTNYDNVLELAAAQRTKKLTPVSLSSHPRHYKNSEEIVCHINGFIDNLTEQTLLNEFKLTNVSYLTTQFRESSWSEVFIRHIQSAHAIFFVGYSLYDLDIQEILYKEPAIKGKTFFIQRESMTEEDLKFSDLNDFGLICPIGVEGFAKDLFNASKEAPKENSTLVLCDFEELSCDFSLNKKARATDVFDLLLRGQVNKDLLLSQASNSGEIGYCIQRDNLGDMVESKISENKNYVVTGDIGNGKTTILLLLCGEYLKRGYRIFFLRDEAYDCYDEVEEILRQSDPVVLVFDTYARKMDLLAHANLKRRSDTIFMLAARTSLHRTYEEDLYFKSVRIDAAETCEINCNKLTSQELSRISEYFSYYGIWGEKTPMHEEKKIRYLQHKCQSEMHAVLLDLLASPDIQQRFSGYFKEINGSKQMALTAIAAFALNLLNITRPTPHMIAAITNDSSIFNAKFKANASIKLLFNSQDGAIIPKSSALAEFSLKNFPDHGVLVDSLVTICKATRKKADGSKLYWDLYRDMASFSYVQRMLPDSGKRDLLIRFYEGIKTISVERDNPLFWLQYAMAHLTVPDATNLEQAHQYLKTALAQGRAKPNFHTTDIETQYARYHLEFAANIAANAYDAYANFVKAHDFLYKITKVEVYKVEPFRPIRIYSEIYKKFSNTFNKNQKIGYVNACKDIFANIKKLPPKTADDAIVIYARNALKDVISHDVHAS